jgi:predicted ATPase/DNA-binding CsgD family transcriptional regulator
LPTQLTNFVGRAREMAEVRGLARESRLVTLTGTGGSGKTRLALHVAADAVEQFGGGVWFVDLAPRRAGDVPWAALEALGVRVDGDEPALERVVRALGASTTLLVLDNCEHVVDAAADLTDAILRRCRGVTVLATSRTPLRVDGEVVYRVPSLSLPAQPGAVEALALCDAVALFVDRARKARPNFVLSELNADTVASVCRRLDGIPLALELAAARVRVLSPDRILAGLDDRFRILGAGPRTALPRQATLAASVVWSHDLLTEVERVVFRRLAVFAGSFDLDAAEEVVTDDAIGRYEILDVVAALVDRSLVSVDHEDGRDGYVLLETLRAFGGAQLAAAGETDSIKDRHLSWVIDLAERLEPALRGRSQVAALTRLAAMDEERRAAAVWAAQKKDPEPALRLAAATGMYAARRGLVVDALPTASAALARAGSVPPRLRARAGWGAAHLSFMSGEYEAAGALALEAAAAGETCEDRSTTARCLAIAGWVVGFSDAQRGAGLLECAIAAARDSGDRWALAESLKVLGYHKMVRADVAGVELLAQARVEAERAGDEALALEAAVWHGNLLMQLGHGRAARDVTAGVVDRFHQLGNPHLATIAETVAAAAASLCGDHAGAERLSRQAVEFADRNDNGLLSMYVHGSRGWVLARAGDIDAGELALERALAIGLAPTMSWIRETYLALRVRVLVDASRFDAARELLERLPQSDHDPRLVGSTTVAKAVLSWRDGAPDKAEDLAHDALEVGRRYGDASTTADALELLAVLTTPVTPRDAVRLLGAAQAFRDEVGCQRSRGHEERHAALHTELVAALDADEYAQALAEGTAMHVGAASQWVARRRGRRGRPVAGWMSLTPTEVKVAVLVGDGLTNAQIGERLLIGTGTVKTHLAHIFTKLGIGGRAHLATFVARNTASEPKP